MNNFELEKDVLVCQPWKRRKMSFIF